MKRSAHSRLGRYLRKELRVHLASRIEFYGYEYEPLVFASFITLPETC